MTSEDNRHKIYSQYAARNQLLYEALHRYNTEGLIKTPSASSGLYSCFGVPRTVNLERLHKRLAERKVMVVTGKRYYLSDFMDRDKFLRISVSRADPKRIEEGIKTIVGEIEICMAKINVWSQVGGR